MTRINNQWKPPANLPLLTHRLQPFEQSVDIHHVCKNKQPGDRCEQIAGSPDEVAPFHATAGVFSKLSGSHTHHLPWSKKIFFFFLILFFYFYIFFYFFFIWTDEWIARESIKLSELPLMVTKTVIPPFI